MTHVGAIVLVPFPYSDRLAEKRRPALVVARPNIGEGPELFWLAMITTARRSAWIVRTIGTVSSTVLDQVRANIRRELESEAR
jgi:mRNA-degrading endonuclease toxin of MazEF toxin-antitoxin module